jgi:hypothetical protein
MALGEKFPFAKIELLRASQMDQREACQIKRNPLRILAFLAAPLNNSKSNGREGGITIETCIHFKISPHTHLAQGQCKNK